MKEYISDKLLLNLTKIFIYDNNDKIGKINILSLNSWLSHVKHANSYRLVNRYVKMIKHVM